MPISAAQVKSARELLCQLKEQDPDPRIRLSPYLDFSGSLSGGYVNERKVNSGQLKYLIERVLNVESESRSRKWRQDIGALVNKLSCETALSTLFLHGGERISPSLDGVRTIDATGGLTVETLQTIVSQFDCCDDLVFVVSSDEFQHLQSLATMYSQDSRFSIARAGQMHFWGMQILPVYTYDKQPILNFSRGIRSCFALQKGAVKVYVNWSIAEQDEHMVVDVEAIRLDGEKVVEVKTIG